MKIKTYNKGEIRDSLYFIKTTDFKITELINEFGIRNKEEYYSYIINILSNYKFMYKTILITQFRKEKNEKLQELDFYRLMNDIVSSPHKITKKSTSLTKNLYSVALDKINDNEFYRLLDNEFTLILSDISLDDLSVIINDNLYYQLEYDQLVNSLVEPFVIISHTLATDADAYFIIES